MNLAPVRFADIAWPQAGRFWLKNASVPVCMIADATAFAGLADADGVVHADLLIDGGNVVRIDPPRPTSGSADGVTSIDLDGRQVWPTLIDIHTHLDKGHTVDRSPNPDGTFTNARLSTAADRPRWDAQDLRRRMGFGLRCAYAHGVSAIRTHIDTYVETIDRTWPVLREMREEWRGRIDLQAVSLCPIELLLDEYGDKVAAVVAQSGGLLGGAARPAIGDHGAPDSATEAQIERVFALAKRHDLDIDLHVDETNDPQADTLPFIARATVKHGYQGRVVCGHCCSLAVQPESQVDRTLDLLAEAQIAIVTLPTVNMYLQDRQSGRTPRWRGVTVVHEMLKRGIPVSAAGDNCRDSFYAYGDHDVMDTFRQAVRVLHLDHPVTGAPALVSSTPSAVGKFAGHGLLAAGSPARFVVFNARTLNELISRPQADRVVFNRGQRVREVVPDYDELAVAG